MRPTTLAKSLLTAAIFAVVLACNPISDPPVTGTGATGPISDWPSPRGVTGGPESEEEGDDSSEPGTLEPISQGEQGQGETTSPTRIETPPLGAGAFLDAGTPAVPSTDAPAQADANTADAGDDAGDDAGGDAGAAEASVEAAL